MDPEDELKEPEEGVIEAEDAVIEAESSVVEQDAEPVAVGEEADVVEPAPVETIPALVAVEDEVSLEPLGGDVVGELGEDGDLTRVLDVPVELTVEMGRTTMTIRETLGISNGTIVTLNRLVGEPVDLFANGRLIARGEVIAVDEEYGLRVTEVLARAQQKAA